MIIFFSGKPAELYEEDNPDWIPSLYMGYTRKSGDIERFYRRNHRQNLKDPEQIKGQCFKL